jgi:hypothetical protein
MAKTWVVYRVADGGECRECGVLEPAEWEELSRPPAGYCGASCGGAGHVARRLCGVGHPD